MLNRKLTEADIGKEFSCNYHGTTRVVKLLDVENSDIPYCFGTPTPVLHIWTTERGVSVAVPLKISVSEIEEPEEFKLTGEEIWRASTDKEEKELNDALGLKELNLKIDSSVFDALEEEAKQQGIILKALVRQILTDYLA